MGANAGIRTILIVDDDNEWRQFLFEVLGKHYAVMLATSGEDGIAMAERAHPSLIMLDVMMPGGKDGFTTFAELRKNPATHDIPVIFVSGVNLIENTMFGAESLKQFLGHAPAAFLEKPVKQEAVLLAVRKVLEPDPA